MIVRDILERLYSAEMVLCDLSGRNPNVLFELGFRQAFNKPVTLIKDLRTERIFDISGLRDISYDESLRIDAAQTAIDEIASGMRATFEAASGDSGINSLVQLLSIESAVIPQRTKVSNDTQLMLNAIRELGDRISELEARSMRAAEGRRKPAETSRLQMIVEARASPETMNAFADGMKKFVFVRDVGIPVSLTDDRLVILVDVKPDSARAVVHNRTADWASTVGLEDVKIFL